jgi:hypothetical protein
MSGPDVHAVDAPGDATDEDRPATDSARLVTVDPPAPPTDDAVNFTPDLPWT